MCLFLLPSLALSLLLTFFLSVYVLKFAQDQDSKDKINDYKAHFSKLEQRALNAEQRAKAQYQTALYEAEERTKQAHQEIHKALQIELESKDLVRQAQESVQASKVQAQRAEKKKRNAMGAAERIKRKTQL